MSFQRPGSPDSLESPPTLHALKLPSTIPSYTLPLSPPPSPPLDGLSSSQHKHFAFTTTPPLPHPSSFFNLLRLPVDLLCLIADLLPPPDLLSLSLSCRATHRLSLPRSSHLGRRLDHQDKRQLLLALEHDSLGEGHYYCHGCNVLHPFQPYWAPHSHREKAREPAFHCGQRNRFSPGGNGYGLAYYHARLVVNAHLYGPAHGIPLEAICVSHEEERDATIVRCSTAARIIRDELFIHRTYAFTLQASTVPLFRAEAGPGDFRICEHTPFFRSSSVYHQFIIELARRPAGAGEDGLAECEASRGACGLCLMDYDITIERIHGGGEKAWEVTIRTYHQVGSCRSPDDWKWARFTEKARPPFLIPEQPNRHEDFHPPGSVMQQWFEVS